MKRRFCDLLACATSLIALTQSAERVQAAVPKQTSPVPAYNSPVVLADETIGHFDTAFGTLSASAQVTIIAEGVPLHQILTPAEASALISSVVGLDVKLDEEVTLIALAYDYDAERTSRNCFLLHKRHSDPNDLPDVSYAEIVHCLQGVLGLVDSIVPAKLDSSQLSSMFDLYASLTPEQLDRAHAGIALSELDPTQRGLALATATQSAMKMQTSQVRWALNQMLALQDDRTIFTWTSKSGPPRFGIEGPFGQMASQGRFCLIQALNRRSSGTVRPISLAPILLIPRVRRNLIGTLPREC